MLNFCRICRDSPTSTKNRYLFTDGIGRLLIIPITRTASLQRTSRYCGGQWRDWCLPVHSGPLLSSLRQAKVRLVGSLSTDFSPLFISIFAHTLHPHELVLERVA